MAPQVEYINVDPCQPADRNGEPATVGRGCGPREDAMLPADVPLEKDLASNSQHGEAVGFSQQQGAII